ncbi:hypothetical protein C0991_006407, partial [Blastosporella zonata]
MLRASKTLGRIAKIGGVSFGESFMDKEVPAATAIMHHESSRYAGVLILKELAQNSPMFFHSHIGSVLEQVLLPLRDQRIVVREGAAELLAACLEVAMQRERPTTIHLHMLLQEAQLGLRQTALEVIHGSLLTYREVLLHAGMSISEIFLSTAENIVNLRSHRELLIRRTVVALIPLLAAYDTQTFNKFFLHKAMAHLLAVADKPLEREPALLAIGNTATAVGGDIVPFLDTIMMHIKRGFQERGKNPSVVEPSFQCVTLLAAAVGPNLTKMVHNQLDLMLSCGLSEPLWQALVAITRHIPPLLNTVQNRLLDLISNVLSGTPYIILGTLAHGRPRILVAPVSRTAEKSAELIALALEILGSFNFTGHVLNEFIHINALPYLDDDRPETRRIAAVTCCRHFVCDPSTNQASNNAVELINDVLNKLLTVGVADPGLLTFYPSDFSILPLILTFADASVRHAVLSSLHERFDRHLAQAENVRSLFIVLNDEDFENRVVAVRLIGRLSKHNPAYVMPPLRKMLIQLLTELEYSSVLATQHLIKPYALPMLRVLLQKATDSQAAVAGNVLTCLGELTCVSGEDVVPFVPELMTVIISCLTDSSAASLVKRDAALRILGQVCSSTGYVIAPLIDHPQLLELLGRILKTDSRKPVQREVLKILGIVGAIDPYRRKNRPDGEATESINIVPLKDSNSPPPTSVDPLQSVVFHALLVILNDQTLSTQHVPVIEAIMSIFKTQGLKCVAFLPQIIPAFAAVAHNSSARLGFYLEQLAILIGIVKHNIRNLVPDILALITELWTNDSLHLPLVNLIEALGRALGGEFKPFFPTILPLILGEFGGESNERRTSTQIKIFDVFLTVGGDIDEYLQLILPILVVSYERADNSTSLRKRAIQTVEGLSKEINLSHYASRIIHPLVRVLDSSIEELQTSAMDTFSSLVLQLGSDFAIFIPTINKAILKNQISHPRYEELTSKVLNGQSLSQPSVLEVLQIEATTGSSQPAEATSLTVNQQHLKQAWNITPIVTNEDWTKWMHRLVVEFIKESTSHALRACMTLVGSYLPLGKELFNVAFLSCWTELYEQYQEDLIRSIEHAMAEANAPPELVHLFLDLAEFMERKEKPLPIEHRTLGVYAMKHTAYAKALHYKELEFFSKPSPEVIESLISINTRLQQYDAAWGTILTAHEHYEVTQHEEWYERLGRWQEALVLYDRKAKLDPFDRVVEIGRMKCLHALGEWDHLAAQVRHAWPIASPDYQREIAPMGAAAAWSLHDWGEMEDYITAMNTDTSDRAFYRAILAVHENQFPKALVQIAKARDVLVPELDSLVGEAYSRSYNILVRAQMLSELEEIILYKQHADQPERQKAMKNTWMKRLRGCQPSVEVWQRVLQIRTLVLDPETDPETWIKFANLCRKSNRMALAEKTINSLIVPHIDKPDIRGHIKPPPHVIYAQLKYMWATGSKADSIEFLRRFSVDLNHDLTVETGHAHESVPKSKLAEISKLLARCYLKMAQWEVAVSNDWIGRNVEEILKSYQLATHFDPSWYKAWRAWAMVNFEVISYIDSPTQPSSMKNPDIRLVAHIVQAVNGFFRSISLRNEEPLQDTLRLLTLWFKYGSINEVSHEMSDGFVTVDVVVWLPVIPQIIARIQTHAPNVRRTINQLLDEIGKHHPQALIYPLTVASKSTNASRSNVALTIMGRMREHSPTLVSQGSIIIRELVRVALLWHELWREGIEEASRRYQLAKDPDGMIAILEPLYEQLEAGPTTTREISFVQAFGRDLREAREATRRWRTHGDTRELDKAWDLYSVIYKKIEQQHKAMTTLHLQYVSPSLLTARNLELAVPGTYQNGRPVITIDRFNMKIPVIISKQNPRRLTIKGSDGRSYLYLLKGGEDLRQDERVMQLFSLVNGRLSTDTESFKRRLHIQEFPVIPLDTRVGLIGWVQDTDTLHTLIKDYRDSRRILYNIEHRLMLQMAPDYDKLILLQQIEVFEHGLESTTGIDLYRILWLKSTSSENWLERRATYTRSLAVNSMVGYILGLGDRHPANLLIERTTGKVVHIDFGDCWEIAMDREHFKERVPFRLTRMMTHAMEVSGIEGSFRQTCEVTMRVLRDNRDSLMAVLEALVYDPLITWRLVQTKRAEDTNHSTDDLSKTATAVHLQAPARKLRTNENDIFGAEDQEERNERALAVYNRVQHKLTGRDFNPDVTLDVEVQVNKLIEQATAVENLCGAFPG